MLTQRHTVVSIPGDGNSGVSQYDLGRLIHWKDFQRTNHLDQPPTILRTAVSDLESQHDEYGHTIPEDIEARMATAKVRVSFKRTLEKPDVSTDRLFKPGILHDEAGICPHCAGEDESALIRREPRNSADDEDDPAIHTGPITSGNTSLEAANVQDQIAKDDGVLCFEMEASRLMNWFPCLVILVICDYCVIHKNKGWQLYPLQRMRQTYWLSSLSCKWRLRALLLERSKERCVNKVLAKTLVILTPSRAVERHVNKTDYNVDKLHQENTQQKILQWLNASNISRELMAAKGEQRAGTCTWIRRSPHYQDWEIHRGST